MGGARYMRWKCRDRSSCTAWASSSLSSGLTLQPVTQNTRSMWPQVSSVAIVPVYRQALTGAQRVHANVQTRR